MNEHTPNAVHVEQTNGGTQYTIRPIADVANSHGVLSTATTDKGNLVTQALKATDRVTVAGGMEVTVEQAVQHGYLNKNTDGTYSDVETPKEASESNDDPQESNGSPEDSEGGLEVSDATNDTLANWSPAIAEFTGSNAAVVAVLGEMMTKGPDHMPSVLESMASHHGVDVGQLQDTIRDTYSDINDAFCDYVNGAGVDPNGFFEYMNTNSDPAAYRSAVASAIVMRDMGPLAQLVSQYKASGQGQANNDDGQTVKVEIQGRRIEMTKAAARARGYSV